MVIKRASGTRTNHCIYTLQSLVLNINCFSFNAPVLHVIVIVHIPKQFWFPIYMYISLANVQLYYIVERENVKSSVNRKLKISGFWKFYEKITLSVFYFAFF